MRLVFISQSALGEIFTKYQRASFLICDKQTAEPASLFSKNSLDNLRYLRRPSIDDRLWSNVQRLTSIVAGLLCKPENFYREYREYRDIRVVRDVRENFL